MAIDKPTDYFNTKLYTGNNTADHNITGVGFQPNWVWIKRRNSASDHMLYDSVRGVTKDLRSNQTNAESTDANGLSSFDSDGFTIETSGFLNSNNDTFVSWNWLAGGSASSNTDGSITSSVSANTTAGFSIVSYTGTGADATVGHGLSQAPTIFILKNRTDASDWRIGQVLTSTNNMTDGNGYYMELNSTKASTNPGSATTWGATPTAPTSSVFTVGSTNAHNGSSDNIIAYCFHSVKGYSKFGSYTGNGSSDGSYIHLGFKPAFVIIKRTDTTSEWHMIDNKRNTFNTVNKVLSPNTSGAEVTTGANPIDFLSNSFKCRGSGTQVNASGGTYIYMAFASNPFVTSTGIPTTAR